MITTRVFHATHPDNMLEKAYINHTLGYASSFKQRVDQAQN